MLVHFLVDFCNGCLNVLSGWDAIAVVELCLVVGLGALILVSVRHAFGVLAFQRALTHAHSVVKEGRVGASALDQPGKVLVLELRKVRGVRRIAIYSLVWLAALVSYRIKWRNNEEGVSIA